MVKPVGLLEFRLDFQPYVLGSRGKEKPYFATLLFCPRLFFQNIFYLLLFVSLDVFTRTYSLVVVQESKIQM